MAYLDLILNAKIVDVDGYNVGEVLGFQVTANRMSIKIVVNDGYDFEDDDGGSKEDIPTIEFTPEAAVAPLPDLRLVTKEGTSGK